MRSANSRQPARGWLYVASAVIAAAWGGNQFVPLLLFYRGFYGYSSVEVALFLAFYIVGIVPGFALAGPWSDRYGRKPVLLAGMLLGILGSLILAFASSTAIGMCAGRVIGGLSVAAGMVAGSSWIKELSTIEGRPDLGARRASLALSVGFGGGAGIAGILAQWGPAPTLVPYGVHIIASLAATPLLLKAAETRAFDPRVTSLRGDLRIPKAARKKFWGVIAPLAPWVFAAPVLAFAVGPSLVADQLGDQQVAFATLVTVLVLGVGTLTQLFSRPLIRALHGHAMSAAVVIAAIGAIVLSTTIPMGAIWPVLAAAPFFGIGYGLAMVAGLSSVQALSSADDLAGSTAVFYGMTYAGFLLPAALAALNPIVPYPSLLLGCAAVCIATAAWSSIRLRKH
ncbi:MFS transporter [Arthrobacter sp. CAN_C5]|uniref:MFS transporter n=1 Tax=Arthrobacter sp. CAN_C5 TaxID=2760706 RepID=UPI001AE27746|nr:MFS transporter [Arthrobacter sp. CAN_C5]MBP2217016.1 MFS family permease [Arthrobacter sp. CAN_C5]